MRKQRVTACDNFFSANKDVRCNGRYCDACIVRHYLENPESFSNLSSWICYRCTGRCTCAACKRRRKAHDDGEEGIELDPEPRKREHRRFFVDDSVLYDDDEFEPRKRHSGSPSESNNGIDSENDEGSFAGAVPSPPRMAISGSAPRMAFSHAALPTPASSLSAAPTTETARPALHHISGHSTSGMSALALLAEESLTTEFIPAGSVVPVMQDALELMHEHTEEIAKLKQMCLLLQMQVAELSKQVGAEVLKD